VGIFSAILVFQSNLPFAGNGRFFQPGGLIDGY